LESTQHDILGFLFRENLSQIVEMALITKKEALYRRNGKIKIFNSLGKDNTCYSFQTLHPHEILEVYRRCTSNKENSIFGLKQRCSAQKKFLF
jgi:hypothetical protein